MVAVVAVGRAPRQARRLEAELLLVLVEVHRLAADRPLRYRHCREHPLREELLKAEVVAVAMALEHQPRLPSNGSFTSKETARTARERQSTMWPTVRSKISASTIARLPEPGSPARRKVPSSLPGSKR